MRQVGTERKKERKNRHMDMHEGKRERGTDSMEKELKEILKDKS